MEDIRDAVELIQRAAQARDDLLARLSPEEQETLHLAKLRVEREIRHRDSPLAQLFTDDGPFRRDLYPHHVAFMSAGKTAKERMFLAGNRVGKTLCAAYETTLHLTGRYPEWWQGRVFDEPVTGIAAGVTMQVVKATIAKEYCGHIKLGGRGRLQLSGKGLIPPDDIIEDSIEFAQGDRCPTEVWVRYRGSNEEYSTLSLRAFAQKRESFQGVSRHFVWLDEEVPMDIYSECLMRTATTGGLMIATFTPLKGISELVRQFLQQAGEMPGGGEPYSVESEKARFDEMFGEVG